MGIADLGILVELVCNDIVNREDDLDIILLGFLNECSDFFGSRLIEERVADLHCSVLMVVEKNKRTNRNILERLFESKRHTTTDDQRIDLFQINQSNSLIVFSTNLVQHVVDQLDLI